MAKRTPPYRKPGPVGGKLIRELIRNLRTKASPPLGSHILSACSGGADSVALAVLLARYGRRIADPGQVTLLHFNHGWRGEASNQDEEYVAKLARKLGVGFESAHASRRPRIGRGESWEEAARTERKRFFREKAAAINARVLTAHHGDDLAETFLWRLFTGAVATHGGGILWQDGPEIRPLLTVRRAELRAFLKEEKIRWREDTTNQDPRFLRARMRQEITPPIEALFPRAIPHLIELALEAQKSLPSETDPVPFAALFGQTGARIRRVHWEHASRIAAEAANAEKNMKIALPGDWLLEREGGGRWILSRNEI